MWFTKYMYQKNIVSKISKMSIHQHAINMFEKAVSSVQPQTLIKEHVRIENNNFIVKNKAYTLPNSCYIVGFGKAVLGMAVEMESILGANLKAGIVNVPIGITKSFDYRPRVGSRLEIIEGARNNLPDSDALKGANKIKNLCDQLGEGDLLIVLMSGGGSALLPSPRAGIGLEEKTALIKDLANRGADIAELNCVRKKLSQLKGGGLAQSAFPSRVIALILSDVIGDPLDVIASGPTVRNLDDETRGSNEPSAAMRIIQKYNINTPKNINDILNTPSTPQNPYYWVDNFVIGNNTLACERAKSAGEKLGYSTAILSTEIQGDVKDVSKMYADLSKELSKKTNGDLNKVLLKYNLDDRNLRNLDFTKPVCIVAGGEPTVVVKGSGKGGRNQELALLFSQELKDADVNCEIVLLSCGTDGIDGPTDAAGAIGSNQLIEEALRENIDSQKYSQNNDAYHFYEMLKNGKYLVKTGHTGTNVMDVHVLLVKPLHN